jgi:hypothetical protein
LLGLSYVQQYQNSYQKITPESKLMDDITLNLIVLAAFALIGGLIFFLVRHKQAASEQEIVQMAAEHGWTYESVREPLAWGLRLKSPRWTLEAISRSSGKETGPGSSDVTLSTTWHTDAPGSALLIGEHKSQANLGGFGKMLTRQVLQLALGADANGLTEIQAGSETFQQKYILWAQETAETGQLLTPAIESSLLAWKGEKPLIKRTSAGLTIELRGVRLQKADEINAIVQLGEALLAAWKS